MSFSRMRDREMYQADIATRLADPRLFIQHAYVNGKMISARDGADLQVTNPSTGRVIGTVPDCGTQETEDAIAAAERAFQIWRRASTRERAEVLERWHDLILDNIDDLGT